MPLSPSNTDRVVRLLIVAFLAYLIIPAALRRWYGQPIIGHWLEKSEYEAQYYVNVFPEGADVKNYRLPGDIWRTTEYDYGAEEEGAYTYRLTYLMRAYLPNGGYLEFEDCEVEVGEINACWDQRDRQWDVELTLHRVRDAKQ